MTMPSRLGSRLPRHPPIARHTAALGLALVVALTFMGCEASLEERPSPEQPEVHRTLAKLRVVATLLDPRRLREAEAQPPRTAGSVTDPTGLLALATGLVKREVWGSHNISFETARGLIRGPGGALEGAEQIYDATDQWGRPFIYRCPGPVHSHGWDLYSAGPDGVDDHGAGDDVLVGRDWDD